MTSSSPPDYYTVLEIPSSATQQQIRDGYKKAALKSHPDRVASDSPEREERTKKFQLVNDAYYTLSDPARRREYDAARAYAGTSSPSGDERIPPGGFPWSSFGFTSSRPAGNADGGEQTQTQADAQFEDVFEEMLRDEGLAENGGQPTSKFWGVIGGLSGGAMGFIVANFPGMLAGAVAGNRLGAIRDARKKSVYEVFQELAPGDRARLLSQLAAKVFAHAVAS